MRAASAFVVLFIALVVVACGGPSPTPKCDASCVGCCDATGQCQSGTSTNACGSGGLACSQCGAAQVCQLGLCLSQGAGGGGGTGGGAATGGGGGAATGGGAGGGAATGGGGGAAGRTVTATALVTFLGPAGPTTYARNLTSMPISVAVDTDGAGTWQSRSATPVDAGVVRIDDVPAGRAYVGFGRNYVDSAAALVQFDQVVLGRLDAAPATVSTPTTFDFTGLEAWGSGHYIAVQSFGAGASADGLLSSAPAITGGATSGSATVDWAQTREPLINGSAGDAAIITQLSPRALTGSGFPYRAASRVATVSTLTQVNGQATSVAVPFTPTSATLSLPVDLRVPEFAAQAPAVSAGGEFVQVSLAVASLPAGASAGTVERTPGVVFIGAGASDPTVSGAAVYANPYPSAWAPVFELRAVYRAPLFALGQGGELFPQYFEVDHLAQLPTVQQPRLSPPRLVQVAGRDATTTLTSVGLTPLVSWTAPAVGTPERYVVGVYELSTGATTLVATPLVQVTTKQTSARLPPGALQVGRTYALTVQAEVRGGVEASARPFFAALPVRVAGAATQAFTP